MSFDNCLFCDISKKFKVNLNTIPFLYYLLRHLLFEAMYADLYSTLKNFLRIVLEKAP